MFGRLYDIFQNVSDRSKAGETIGGILFTRLLNLQFGVLIPMYAMLIFSIDLLGSAARHLNTAPDFYPDRQSQWIVIGTVAMLVLVMTPMRWIKWASVPGYFVALVLSVMALFRGNEVHQLEIGGIAFQPAQLMIAMGILTLSFALEWMDSRTEGAWAVLSHPICKLLVTGVIVGLPFLLVVVVGDMGFAMVWIPMALFVLLNAKLPLRYILLISFLVLSAMPVMYYGVLPKVSPRGAERIEVYLDLLQGKEVDIQNEGYAAHRVGLVIGKAGWKGVGSNAQVEDGSLHARGYVPMNTAHNDYVFAVFAEEQGFRGVVILLFAYLVLFLSLLFIASLTPQFYGRLVVVGFVSVLFAHVFENIGMCVGLMPITGIPLPFMSYSGTFTLICMAMIGVCQSIWLESLNPNDEE